MQCENIGQGELRAGLATRCLPIISGPSFCFVLFCFCTVPKLEALFIAFNGWEKEINRRFCGS